MWEGHSFLSFCDFYVFPLRTWKKLPKVENMPNISINNAVNSPNVNYIRWKVHGDWVTQVKKKKKKKFKCEL